MDGVRRLGCASALNLPLRHEWDVWLVQVCGVHEPRMQGDWSGLGARAAVQAGCRGEEAASGEPPALDWEGCCSWRVGGRHQCVCGVLPRGGQSAHV
jgi:hypothetical protein